MINVELSRRVGRVSHLSPIGDLSTDRLYEFVRAVDEVVDANGQFEDLPEVYRQMVLEAETADGQLWPVVQED